MLKGTLVTLSIAVVIAAVSAFPDRLRAQTAITRFEYLRVTPFPVSVPTRSNHITVQPGYRVCLAASTEWGCRLFRPESVSDAVLATMLTTLGDEGWELVSAIKEEGPTSGLTYFFKRQARVLP
jgi:hypothetical protein